MARSLRVLPEFIQKVKRALLITGYSQQELASRSHLSRDTVNKFLNGKSVSTYTFISICKILKLEWQVLAGLDAIAPSAATNSNSASLPTSRESSEGSSSHKGKEEANESHRSTTKFVITGDISGEVDASKIAAIIAMLQEISGATSITIEKIERG